MYKPFMALSVRILSDCLRIINITEKFANTITIRTLTKSGQIIKVHKKDIKGYII